MTRQSYFAVIVVFLLSMSVVVADEGSTRTGKYFRVICNFKNERIAAQALETAEAVWPVATRLFDLPDRAPSKPCEVHLLRTVADYQRVEAELIGGRFKDNLAFASHKTKAAYLALQPDCCDDTLQKVGLPAQTRRLIAHEAAHLARYAMPNHRSHPDWLVHGAASWIEQQVMEAGGWSADAERDPYVSREIVDTLGLLKERRLPSVDRVLGDDIDQVDRSTRYALWRLLFDFLRDDTEEGKFRAIMREARRLGGGSDYSRRLKAFIEESLGPDRMRAVDGRFADYLRGLRPRWEEVYPSLETAGDEWKQIAFSDTNAMAWRTQPVGRDRYVLAGEFEILPGWQQQLNVLLGRNDDGFVSVAFTAGFGVTVLEYRTEGDRWEKLGSAKLDNVARDRWIPFRVEVAGRQLRVIVSETLAVSTLLGGRSMRGPWGLGAQAGSAGVWRDVSLTMPPVQSRP